MERSSVASYYDADGLGSVTSLSSTAGVLAQTYTFDSFGKQTAATGSITNPFQYTARESDTVRSLLFGYDGNHLAEEASSSGTTLPCSSRPEPTSRGQPLHHLGKRGHEESPSRSTPLHFSNSSWSPNAIIRQPEGGSQWPLVWRA